MLASSAASLTAALTSAGGAKPDAQRNVSAWFWANRPPGSSGSGSRAMAGPATRPRPTTAAPRRAASAAADPDAMAGHGSTSIAGSMRVAAGSRRRAVDGSGAAPVAASSTSPRGRSRPAVAPEPVAHGHEPVRGGELRPRAPSGGQGLPAARHARRRAWRRRGRPRRRVPRPARACRCRPSSGRRRRWRTGSRRRAHRRSRDRPRRRARGRCRRSRRRRRSPGPRGATGTPARRTRRPRAARPAPTAGPSRTFARARRPGRVPAAAARRSRRGSSAARHRGPRASTRSTRCSISAAPSGARIAPRITAASSAIVVAQPRAGIDGAQARAGPVVIADQHDAGDGSRRERLGREGDLPRSPSGDTDREALPRERARRVEHRVQPVPRDAGLWWPRRPAACGTRVGPTAGLPRRTRAGRRRPAGPAAPPRPGAGSHARIGSPPREGPPPAGSGPGGRRARGPVSRRPLTRHLSRSVRARGATGWYISARQRGPRAPAHPTRRDREAGASPAQSRYGDRPSGRKSGRRSAVSLEPSRERSGASCDPPPDPSFDHEVRGLPCPSHSIHPQPELPWTHAHERRTAVAPHRSPPSCCSSWRPSWRPAPRRRRRPPRRRRRSPRPRRPRAHRRADRGTDADAGTGLPGDADRRRGHQRHARRRADQDRVADARRDRDRCSRSAWATRSSARSRTSRRIRPRRRACPTSPSSGPSTSRRSCPWARTW